MGILGDYSKVGKSALNVLKPSGLFTDKPYGDIHFQRNYMWDVILPTFMSGFIPMPGILVSKMCQKISFGDYTIDGSADRTRFGAFEAKYPGMLSIEPIKLTFLKTVPDFVTTYFTAWRKKMVGSSGLYTPKSDYAKTMYLLFYDTTGVVVNRYRFKGIFPTSLPKYSLDYINEQITNVDITLSVDLIDTLY